VEDLIAILKAYPNTEARLEGHTDNVGEAGANLKLSQERANLVKQILVTGGIAPNRLTTAGFGQERPVESNATDAGRAKNRRIELVVIKK
jgi:K(+)-stimulated pyrophosphate-energized sodium pump